MESSPNRNSPTNSTDQSTKAAISTINSVQDQAKSIIETSSAVERDLESARRIVQQVQRLRTDVDNLQTQVEGFYKSQQRELFGGKSNQDRYTGAVGKWTVTLAKQPIPSSLKVRCGAVELYPENYQLAGNKVVVNCDLDINPVSPTPQDPNDQPYIEVVYHSRK